MFDIYFVMVSALHFIRWVKIIISYMQTLLIIWGHGKWPFFSNPILFEEHVNTMLIQSCKVFAISWKNLNGKYIHCCLMMPYFIWVKPRCDFRDFLSRGAVGGTAGWRILIGLVDFQPSVAINAARIRATRQFRHTDHRNRSGTDFFRPAPRNCVPVDRNFLHMASRCHPD